MKKHVEVLKSDRFKKIMLAVGIGFTLVTFVIAFNPDPFVKHGYPGIFLFNIFGTGTFLAPVLARHMNVYMVAAVSAAGMAINDAVTWYVGKHGDVVLPRSKRVLRAEKTLHRYGPLALLLFAFLPNAYDFFGLIAGYLEFPFWRFWIPTFMGRFLRFTLLGLGVISI